MTLTDTAPATDPEPQPLVARARVAGALRDRRRGVVVLAAAIVTQIMTAPGQTVGISVFVDHIADDLTLTRSGISAAYLLGTAAGALSLPLAGRLIDRRGLRWATTTFAVAFGAVLCAMSGVVSFATLAVGFAGTRMLGQGALTLTATTTVAVSFDRHRGTAMGIKSAAGGGLMSLIPLVATVLIATFGWRGAFLALGVLVWVVLLPLARWVIRDPRPRVHHAAPGATAEPVPAASWSKRRVLRHPMFWVMTSAVALSALVSTGLMFHQIDILGTRGLTTAQAAANFIPQTVAAAAAALGAGRLADRISSRILVPGSMLLLGVAPLLLQVVRPGLSAVLYGLVLGAAAGSIRTIEAATLPRWFGVAHIGELRGIVLAVAVAASATGPLLLATTADVAGTYRPALVAMAVAAAVIAVAAAITRLPRTAH